ncbi:gliding motility-associated C-terminal domain-containing protein [Mucilaginibacter sp. HMF5004]|uniref:Ig-like domain-containing protein n=1 Tax=Mucilaginibacter rivuli TaxID=2857527 RepID=UPI001C5D1866|nr:gliding motility-associated C-terminal domain-containing protein [Mucilaginibacter rivuli]MBW4891695.1 gliding motility-associated C-terminal domain-containing protein [Mucilaginibacter rivuli]
MNKKIKHTTFIILLSFPHFLFANVALLRAVNKPDGLGSGYSMEKNAGGFFFTAQPITICSGASIVIKGDVVSAVPDSFAWEVLQGGAWVTAPGVNNTADYPPTLLVNNTSSNIIYDIRRKVTIGGVASYDSFYSVTVLTTAPISNNTITSPAVTVFCNTGSPATIKGSTPTGGIGGFVYQWQLSTDNVTFTDISGANGIDYSPGVLSTTTYYRRIVLGSCTVPSISAAISINILSGVTNNIITPPAINSFCLNGDPTVITGNLPNGGNGLYTYQWQISTDAVNFTDINGATSKDYDPLAISVTTFYRRLVSAGICTVPVYSNVVIINILPMVANNLITAPTVTSFCIVGSPATITGSTPTGGNGGYTYQWQLSTDSTNYIDIAGATSKDYTPAAINVTTHYRRIAVSGSCATPLVSNAVAMHITPLPLSPILAPTSTTICPGSIATFTIINAQAGMTYRWYDSAAKTNLLFTGITYISPPIYAPATLYIENSNGSCASASSTVQINIIPPPAAPVLDNTTLSTCNGSSATVNVLSPQAGYVYNWYTAATGGTPVYTGTSFTTPGLFATTTYYAEGVNIAGCNSTTRTPVVINIFAADVITVQGASTCPGLSVTLSATSNSNTTINWYTTPTGGSSIYTGTTFTIPSLIADTKYYVDATNGVTGCISASRELVLAQVLQPLAVPVVTVDATTGSSVTFKWPAVNGAVSYLVSLDNGITFNSANGNLTHTVTGLQLNQAVNILVSAVGSTACQVSAAGAAAGNAISQTDEIYVPNAFTPNGDGKNDFIYVRSQSIKNLKFYVYSQWGELLFTSTDASTGWDGTFKGTKEPVGVYVYYLKAEMLNGHEVSKKGTITLLK